VWVHCCRLANAFIYVRFALNIPCSREWSNDKRSTLYFTEFNARVNWIRPATDVAQTGQSKPPTKFSRIILDFQKNVMLIYVSCESPEHITIRHVSRATEGPRHPWKIFCPLEKCIGHILNLLDIVQTIFSPLRKLFATSGVPSWLRAWLLTACILCWFPCFCMIQFIRHSSFVLNVVYITRVQRMVI